MPDAIIIILLALCVVLSGFFSGSEIAYSMANKLRLKKMAEKGNKKAQKAWHYAENFPTLISTILIGNNLVNIAASSLMTVMFLRYWPGNDPALMAGIFITSIILIFGEITPKTILSKFAVGVSMAFVVPIRFFEIIFKPVVFVMTKFIKLLSPIWTPKVDEDEEDTSGEELINMIEEVQEEGYIDDETKELVTSAIELKDTIAEEIMKPRVDVASFDINDDVSELLKDDNIFTYSRLLVYEDNIDNIIGILNTKKLILAVLNGKKYNIRSMLQKPILVHKTKSLTSLLKLFKDTGTHIAIVVDEFGGTLGIITLEDILEEIVGDIWDEMDTIEEPITETKEDNFLVDGDMNLDDMFEMVEFDKGDYECQYSTVAGWCTEVLDNFPKVDDEFDFDNDNMILHVKILQVQGVRVEQIRIIVEHKNEDEEEE
ncbi:MAG: HlyC/CorC family transporter [Bacilli bacterium]|nr:HlyC/CorC family transporter [Bacilli bacterium]